MARVMEQTLKNDLRLLDIIKEHPNQNAPKLAELYDCHVSTIYNKADRLKALGLIEITQERFIGETGKLRLMECYRAAELPQDKPEDAVMPEPEPAVEAPAPAPEVPAQTSIFKELCELRAFKARAIELHPDLLISPELLEARAYLADQFTYPEDCKAVMTGQMDDTPAMRAIVAALTKQAA